MALSQELVSISAAGTYRREYDMSDVQPLYSNTYSRGRIVIGFSYQGPFNRPLVITSGTQFVSIFGGIDPRLESQGCYFHRTAMEMLKLGPIIALNLHSYNNSEAVGCVQFGTTTYSNFDVAVTDVFSSAMWFEPWADKLKSASQSKINLDNTKKYIDFNDKVIAAESTSNLFIVLDKTTEVNDNSIKGDGEVIAVVRCFETSVIPFKEGKYIDLHISEDGWDDIDEVEVVNEPDQNTHTFTYTSDTTTIKINLDELQNVVDSGIKNTILVKGKAEQLDGDDATAQPSDNQFICLANTSMNDVMAYVYKTPIDTPEMRAYNIPLTSYYNGDVPFEITEYLLNNSLDVNDYTLADFIYTVVVFNKPKSIPDSVKELLLKQNSVNTNSIEFLKSNTDILKCSGITEVFSYTGVTIDGLKNAAGVDISLGTAIKSSTNITGIVGYILPQCKHWDISDSVCKVVELKKMPVGVEPCINNSDNFNAILNTLRNPDEEPMRFSVTMRDPITGVFKSDKEAPSVWGHTNMWNAISDRSTISFRYLVDCWGYGLDVNSKDIFAKICMAQHAVGLLNAPSALTFYSVPEFVNEFGGLDYKSISNSDKFSVPSLENGASYVGYFYPWNTYNGRLTPPAGAVSNLFIQKANPWDVVAGQIRGVLDAYTPELHASTLDREWLESIGINAIINVGDDRDTICIYGNKTAKQKPVSALSALNFRDFVVYIMDEIENIIRPYVFSENTEVVRSEIVTKCTTFLKSVTATPQRRGGLTAFEITMNDTNNTPEIIDNFYGILDIKIEGARPMEKIVQRLYILPTGALTSNGE